MLLLRRNPKSPLFPNQWDLPGGKVDSGEHFMNSLYREIKEETGMTAEYGKFISVGEFELPNWTIVFLVFTVSISSGPILLSDEHVEYRWFSRSELAELNICPPYVATVLNFDKYSRLHN